MACKSIRDLRLTGARITTSKKDRAIFLFAENVPATEVAKTVEISLDSAKGIRDREHERIMKLRETITRQYERLWEREIETNYNKEVKREYQQLWQEVRKTEGSQTIVCSWKFSRLRFLSSYRLLTYLCGEVAIP